MTSFEKYHGLGNDFLVIEVQNEEEISIPTSTRLCDRHFGVGGDGVLYVIPQGASAEGGRYKMVVINSDGSRPEMCGNGLRCVALHLVRRGLEQEGSFVTQTDAGPRNCTVQLETDDQAIVTTTLGRGQAVGTLQAELLGEQVEFAQVSMGNPHAIHFRTRITTGELDELGARLSATIPGGSNIEVAEIVGKNEITVDVWERGVGRTLACGTGAAATAVAASDLGLVDGSSPISVRLPGGPLEIRIGAEREVTLIGPATWVYSGQLSD